MRKKILLIILLGFLKTGIGYSQDVNFKVGVKDSIQSKILNENRKLMVSLPRDYRIADKSYPVLYLLDGSETSLLNAIVITRYLGAEMIIVAIHNTDRDRDMMPLSTPTYKVDNPRSRPFSFVYGKGTHTTY